MAQCPLQNTLLGMPAVSAMTMPLRVYMLRIYSATIFVLTINSRKMKEMVDFFFVLQQSSGCVLNCNQNSTNGHFIDLGFG